MVPGGGGTWPLLDETSNPKSVAMVLDWMRTMNNKVRVMASVCTGAAVLAKCGFLDGLPAATNHSTSTGLLSTDRWSSGIASLDGSTRGNMSPLRAFRRHGLGLLSRLETRWSGRCREGRGRGRIRLASRSASTHPLSAASRIAMPCRASLHGISFSSRGLRPPGINPILPAPTIAGADPEIEPYVWDNRLVTSELCRCFA